MRVPMEFENPLCAEVDTELFFPEKGAYYESLEAKRLCKKCPHLQECLEWALSNERHGVWGGTAPRDRQKLRKKLGIVLEEEQVA